MNVIVFEGLVKVCNLAGVCVMAKAGQMTSVRSGDNSAPLPPQQATLDVLVTSSNDTNAGAPSGATARAGPHPHLGVWGTVGILAGAVGPGLGVGLTRGDGTKPPQNGCIASKACSASAPIINPYTKLALERQVVGFTLIAAKRSFPTGVQRKEQTSRQTNCREAKIASAVFGTPSPLAYTEVSRVPSKRMRFPLE